MLTVVSLTIVNWVRGEIPDNLPPLPDYERETMTQYCEDSPDGNMTADLVDTGKINSTYAGWKCEYIEEALEAGERVSKNLEKLKQQLEGLR